MLPLLRNDISRGFAIMFFAAIMLPTGVNAQTNAGKKKYKTNTVMLPGFFHRMAETRGDTTYSYEIFKSDHTPLRIDTLSDPKYIAYIHYYKSYKAASSEGGGLVSSPSFFKKISDYERISDNEWIRIDRASMETTHILEHRNKTLRIETATNRDAATGEDQRITYKYYETEIGPSDGTAPEHHHNHDHSHHH